MSGDIPSTAVSMRGGCALPAFVLLFAVGVLAVAFLASTFIRGRPSSTFEIPLAQLAPNDPVYVSTKGFYLVRQPSGDVLALDEHSASREDYLNGCVIRYRETLQGDGRTGLFRGDCSGTRYDLTGAPLDAGSAPMKRHPVTVSGDTVKVQVNTCLDAAGGTVPCKPA